MVNIVDQEKLMKTIITQFCDQTFKFQLNMKILGSIHVIADNNEVLTCLLNEKYFKSPHSRSLIAQQHVFDHQMKSANGQNPNAASEAVAALNLVTTLSQLQQQHQQLKINNATSGNTKNSLSSSSSTSSSKSCASSTSSSYASSSLNEHTSSGKHNKRKRFTPRGIANPNDDALSTASSSSRSNNQKDANNANSQHGANTDDDDDEDEMDHNKNNELDQYNEDQLNSSRSANNTPVKRNKKDDDGSLDILL
jgi:hypothetical protein